MVWINLFFNFVPRLSRNGGPDSYREVDALAEMAELVDARDSNSRSFGVWVRFPLSVLKLLS